MAFEGLEIDRQTGLNVGEIASTSLQMNPSAPVSERVSILTGFLVSGLFHELGFLKKNAPETYFKKIEGGQIFLRVIFMVVVPLVFSALTLGVAGIGDVRKLGRLGLRTLLMTMILSSASVAIGSMGRVEEVPQRSRQVEVRHRDVELIGEDHAGDVEVGVLTCA